MTVGGVSRWGVAGQRGKVGTGEGGSQHWLWHQPDHRHAPHGLSVGIAMRHVVALRLIRLASLAGLATACSDYKLEADDPLGTFDPGADVRTHDSAPEEDSGVAPVEEVCDGLDNDGNGEVDESFSDTDGDGAADCVDADCSVVVTGPDTAAAERSCASGGATGSPEDLEHVWSFDHDGICARFAVADLDSDGVGDIVCGRYGLIAVDGGTGMEKWRVDDIDGGITPVVVGDIDGDGWIDIVTTDGRGYVHAFDRDGVALWVSSVPVDSSVHESGGGLEIADLNGDGLPEIVTEAAVFDGRDGRLLRQWDANPNAAWTLGNTLAVGDIDGNGVQDVIAGWKRLEDGVLVWEADTWEAPTRIVTPLLIQADADDDAEVAFVHDAGVVIVDTDGTELLRLDSPDEYSYSFACAGDIDGDGRPEIVANNQTSIWAWTIDGTVLWTQEASDNSTYTGCSVFDFDSDGAYEVLYEDERQFVVLDGRTGSVLTADADHYSATGGEVAAAVDIDGDGVAEVVVPSWLGTGEDRGALDLYRSSTASWGAGSTLWSTASWSGTALRPDGSVPRYPPRPWLEYGIWRGQPNNPVFGADLSVTITDACVDACTGGTAHIAFQVSNLGPEAAPADTPIAVYTLDADGVRTLSSTVTLGELLWPGKAAAGVEIVLPVAEVLHGVVVVAGDDGSGDTWATPDCDETNDEATWMPEC